MSRSREPQGPTLFDYWDRMAAKVAAQNRALSRERKIERRRLRSKLSSWTPGRQVLVEISRLIVDRHRGPCDTDDAEAYFRAALPWLMEKAGGSQDEESRRQIMGWAKALTPSLSEEEVDASLAEAEKRAARAASEA